MSAVPRRAFHLTLSLGADTKADLVGALESIALRVSRDELTIGVSGGVSSGYIYELLTDPSMTHQKYFADIAKHLSESSASAKAGAV